MRSEAAVESLYQRLIDGWNSADADAMAAVIADDGLVIGFDGTQMVGRDRVASELGAVFADHKTATYVTTVRSTASLGSGAALLHAVAGMAPPGGSEIMPERNSIQTVVACRTDGDWSVALFQTTPAQFHGRPELTDALTKELGEQISQ